MTLSKCKKKQSAAYGLEIVLISLLPLELGFLSSVYSLGSRCTSNVDSHPVLLRRLPRSGHGSKLGLKVLESSELGSSLDEVSNSSGSEAGEETRGTLGCDDVPGHGSHGIVGRALGLELDARLDLRGESKRSR